MGRGPFVSPLFKVGVQTQGHPDYKKQICCYAGFKPDKRFHLRDVLHWVI